MGGKAEGKELSLTDEFKEEAVRRSFITTTPMPRTTMPKTTTVDMARKVAGSGARVVATRAAFAGLDYARKAMEIRGVAATLGDLQQTSAPVQPAPAPAPPIPAPAPPTPAPKTQSKELPDILQSKSGVLEAGGLGAFGKQFADGVLDTVRNVTGKVNEFFQTTTTTTTTTKTVFSL